jgi:undecaprenyl diphosphate synthase
MHIAIIMDGNGRWARRRGLPRSEGHRRGMGVVKETIRAAIDLGVGTLTLYAFSSENWKRPDAEVAFLMRMCEKMITEELPFMIKNDIRLWHIGRKEGLPETLLDTIRKAEDLTRHNKALCLVLAFNYGGRQELVDAIRHLAGQVKAGRLDPDAIDEAAVSASLDTAGIPDPDLLIRTSGEMRLSNFLLWQMSYTEIYVTKTLWPEFHKKHFERAVKDFRRRTRRFGGHT